MTIDTSDYLIKSPAQRDTLPDHTDVIDNGGQRVTLQKACKDDPAELKWTIHYVTQGKKFVTKTLPKNYDVALGDTFSFNLPSNAEDWRVYGAFFTGEPIEAIKSNPGCLVGAIVCTPACDEQMTLF